MSGILTAQKKADEAILEKKFAELYSMLSKAHLGRRKISTCSLDFLTTEKNRW